jgi:site-specific DNA-methyltransferase (adenine-specific)
MSSSFRLVREDAVTWLRSLPPASVDLVVTDPPYESLEKHRARGTTTRLSHSKSSSNDWFTVFPNERFPELFAEIYRVLRKDTHFYLFCDAETMFVAKPMAEEAGFRFWKPLVWHKQKIGMGYHYRATYEFILFFEKGKRKLADLGISDVLEHTRIRGGYPTEKPVSLCEVLIDPFMGAGAVGVASVQHGRNFLGNDCLDSALEISRQRLLLAGAVEG